MVSDDFKNSNYDIGIHNYIHSLATLVTRRKENQLVITNNIIIYAIARIADGICMCLSLSYQSNIAIASRIVMQGYIDHITWL